MSLGGTRSSRCPDDLRKRVERLGRADGYAAFFLLLVSLFLDGAIVHAVFAKEDFEVGGAFEDALDESFRQRVFDVLLERTA